jgi:hypothetical protein
MGIPYVASVGDLVAAVGALTIPLPSGVEVNDVLIVQMKSPTAAPPPILADLNGGTWAAVGPFGGAATGGVVRGQWLWSRYNGTQGPPTTVDIGADLFGRMVAVRGCITTGSPINATAEIAPTFAETVSSIPALTTTMPNCLILDCIVGEGP